jgi:hypothetical protein
MLRITLMNDTKNDDPVIGSVQYNLAGLLRKCIGPDGMSSTRDVYNRPTAAAAPSSSLFPDRQNTTDMSKASASASASANPDQPASDDNRTPSARFERASSSRRKSHVRRSSILNLFRHANEPRFNDNDDDEDPIVFDVIDEPLLKNGRQVGTMQCKIEAWWMNQHTARSLGASAGGFGVGGAVQQQRHGNVDEDLLEGGFPLGGPRTLLSPRHNELVGPPPTSSPILRRLKRLSGGGGGGGGAAADSTGIPGPLPSPVRVETI